ncbi:hypothetical protein Xsto_00247 [Xenorhabdus stockiae]|uniref:Uncharacterized protein n=1 Tax=Xenorhabdus stockiae TaxID=351614 RepID=A0A2D0KW83_9GAMM|nr:hypothetical protein [Xenorhabdus stockiae]PHM67684.1 hypothetical protein Xsto_00247 [Xenorhabdus stockiae]
MLGLEFYTDNGLVQLSDKTPSLGFLRKAGADESNIGWDERYYNYAEVYGAGGKYFFAPVSQLSVRGNSGLEVYSERGELMFSSAMKLLSFVRSFSVDVPNNQHRPFVHAGEAGRRYGIMLIKSQSRQHYKNVRFSPGADNPPFYDDEWDYDVYVESFKPRYGNGRIELAYTYDYLRHEASLSNPGTWRGPPPLMAGFIVDLTMIEG